MTAGSDAPVIVGAELAAGHDGAAEAVVSIRYPNGAIGTVVWTADLLSDALAGTGITSLDELVGQPWTILVEGPHPRQT
jgi:hypothetical protein